MAQDWNLPATGTTVFGTAVKTDYPNAFQSLRSMFSGSSAPSKTTAYMEWADTTNALRKQRNSGDSGWDTIAPLNTDLGRQVIPFFLGSVGATTTFRLWSPQLKKAKVISAHVLSADATSSSDASNNWQAQLHNVTDAVDLLATAVDTNGNEIAANTVWDITADQNQNLDVDDVLQLILTKNGTPTPATLTAITVWLEITYSVA